MKALKPIVIVGARGHAQEVAWLIDDLNEHQAEWDLLGFLDTQHSGRNEHYGYPILDGYDAVAGQPFFVCGMGTPAIRLKEAQCAVQRGWQPVSLVHPTVVRAKYVAVGQGTTVAAGCVLGPYASVGGHCLINTHASVGHNATVGDFSVLSPGARVLGNATLKERTFIGANASVNTKVSVGAGATLGANSFLQSDLACNESALGVLARVFRRG